MRRRILALAMGAVAAAGCSNGDRQTLAPTTTSSSTAATTATTVPTTSSTARRSTCEAVPDQLVAAIIAGLRAKGGALAAPAAVRSGAFPEAYFVSAKVEGVGGDANKVATWATTKLDASAPIYTVNKRARDTTRFPDGRRTNAGYDPEDDGVSQSQSCARHDKLPGTTTTVATPSSTPSP